MLNFRPTNLDSSSAVTRMRHWWHPATIVPTHQRVPLYTDCKSTRMRRSPGDRQFWRPFSLYAYSIPKLTRHAVTTLLRGWSRNPVSTTPTHRGPLTSWTLSLRRIARAHVKTGTYLVHGNIILSGRPSWRHQLLIRVTADLIPGSLGANPALNQWAAAAAAAARKLF